jgi:hypothetical protein
MAHRLPSCRMFAWSPAAVRPLPNRRHWRARCLAPSPEGQWRRHAARPARRRGQYAGGAGIGVRSLSSLRAVRSSAAPFAAHGTPVPRTASFHPAPLGLDDNRSSGRHPGVLRNHAAGLRACRRLGPGVPCSLRVLAHVTFTSCGSLPHAAVRPLPNRRHWRNGCLAPSPEGQWRRHAARPARRRGQYAGASRASPTPRQPAVRFTHHPRATSPAR